MNTEEVRSGVVSLLTDFGPGSVYVGQMHGTLLRLLPSVRIVDLAHDCPFGSVEAAAYMLRRSISHFPGGTVHVVVVDPGVGTDRAILCAASSGHLFVAPDSGVLGGVLALDPESEVRRLENWDWMNSAVSKTFHGRDVLAPAAARLAAGAALSDAGPVTRPAPPPPGPTHDAGGVNGRVLLVDRFGNAITNIPGSQLGEFGGPAGARLRIGASFIEGGPTTFSDVPSGSVLFYVGSGTHLEVAVNGGRAADALHIGVGDRVRLEGKR